MRIAICGLALFLLGCQPVKQVEISRAVDGDTLVLIHPDGSEQRLDLAFIDAPEREQPFGREAYQQLSEWTAQQPAITITEHGVELTLDGQSVNQLMVMQGFAWSKLQIDSPEIALTYSVLQTEAAESGQGIWALEHALRVPPWVWKMQATQRTTSRPPEQERQHRQGNDDVSQD